MTTTEILQDHDNKTPALLVAIDIGLKSWHLAMIAQGGDKRWHQTVAGGDVTVQTPLHPSDVAQAPKLEKQLLIKKSAPDKGEGFERLRESEWLRSW